MKMPRSRFSRLRLTFCASALGFAAAPGLPAAEVTKEGPPMEVVAEFPQQQVTGVAVSKTGRIFVNFPYWSDEHTISVAEIVNGKPQPYPNESWNQKSGDAAKRFVCVQSVFVDDTDTLWILDPAAPKMDGVVAGGAKLLKVDLGKNEIVQTFTFDEKAAPRESYLNDVRVDTANGYAFITDSNEGALVVLNLKTGAARRVLDGHPSVVPEANTKLTVEGNALNDQKRSNRPAAIAADSIALDEEEGYLYYKPLTGYTLYRLKLDDLRDEQLSADQLATRVETVGDAPASDGILFREGRVFFTAIEDNAIIAFDLEDREAQTIVSDPMLKWPDSLAIGADGALYVTTSQIHLTPRYNQGESRVQEPFRLLKLSDALNVMAERTAE